jgi:esterase/lipase
MKKFFKWLVIVVLVLAIVYLFGPRPSHPKYLASLPVVPEAPLLDGFLLQHEKPFDIKPENEARIVWHDSLKRKTPYSIVYLHGFTASQEEGDPVHTDISKRFGCNLYLARLAEHGLKDTLNALRNFTVDQFWESCKEAYAIGKQLGEKVILMSTSTGGTAALKLAATYPEIAGLVLMSPNIAINDPNAWLLNNPWGKQIAKLVKGGSYIYSSNQTDLYKKYWNSKYRIESAVQLEEMLETSMNKKTFSKITQPLLLLYYYADEDHHDKVVSVKAMIRMFEQVATPVAKKQSYPIPGAANHVLGSYVISKDIPAVETRIADFLTGIMGMTNNK